VARALAAGSCSGPDRRLFHPLHCRCILQWYYLTGNTCNPGPCNPADPYHPNCDRMSMGYCGTRLQSYPEVGLLGWAELSLRADMPTAIDVALCFFVQEFWNCADIAIRPRRK
jgi:hypothetical protein